MILLLSGGIDSFIAWHYLGKPRTIYFPLGTPYTEKEIKVVSKMNPNTIFDHSLSRLQQNPGINAFVPHRNLYFAMEASRYDDDVVIAGIKGDDVADKTEAIFEEFSCLLTKTGGRRITVTSPFWNMTKEEIIDWYMKNVPERVDLLHDTVSCYSETAANYCGWCPSCFRKFIALKSQPAYDNILFSNVDLKKEYLSSALAGKYIPERNSAIVNILLGEFS